MSAPPDFTAARPVVLRGGTVLPMDDAHQVLEDTDVLVDGRPDRRGRPGAGACPTAPWRSTPPAGW